MYLPARAPAFYCISVAVRIGAFQAELGSYLTVPEQVLDANLAPSCTTARPGERLPFTVINTGPTPLQFGVDYVLEHLDAGEWRSCNVEEIWIAIGLNLPPGGRYEHEAIIHGRAPPGRYRVTKDLSGVGTSVTRRVRFEFDVTD